MSPPSSITPTMTSQQQQQQQQQHPIRARHTIRLSSIRHNFNIVSSAANKQKCSVIVVVKADGYGHGAIETAIHLADYCGADAFAVATLEEGIALRKAFVESSNVNTNQTNMNIAPGSSATTTSNRASPVTLPSLFMPPPPPSSIEVQSQSDTSSISTAMMGHKPPIVTTAKTPTILNPTIITRKKIRSNHIRILVLGPPTNIPSDFNLYLHYNIEVMISSTKMARALMEWVADCDGRKIAEVDQVANERKQELLLGKTASNLANLNLANNQTTNDLIKKDGGRSAATLTSLGGEALGKELLAIMANKAKDVADVQVPVVTSAETSGNGTDNNYGSGVRTSEQNKNSIPPRSSNISVLTQKNPPVLQPNNNNNANGNDSNNVPFPFKGIEEVAKDSRTRELANAKIMAHFTGEGDVDDDGDCDNDSADYNSLESKTNNNNADNSTMGSNDNESSSVSRTVASSPLTMISNEDKLLLDDTKLVSMVSSAVAEAAIAAASSNAVPVKVRKKIRWHALVDSGMGRLGFKSLEDEDNDGGKEGQREDLDTKTSTTKLDSNVKKKIKNWKVGPHKEIVSIIKDMCHAEIDGAPIEFHGMCTHMAEASSDSSYTNEQMVRFKSLLKSVRQANISVPTISTDNSAALLTQSLTHFDPAELLSQPNADTRGYVRTGGAVYGQRPVFTQLRTVSTLTALVRHVAILMEGETVGYDRAYKAEKNVRIATLSIGFADGYPRELGNGKGKVCIRGEKFPIAGNVCMDMLMVDLGCADEMKGIGPQVSIGDTAYLWGDGIDNDGEDNVKLQDIANTLNTTQSALTCGLDKIRVQRQYVD